ncbi:interleukin-6 receptor subunit beta-like [Lethenteron reissneri]|uniref:interleukin-6 receptor subunit beta-like n=1 Tax=Lethenteron reissneri TaxID=7753 RepID=UPI002AB7D3E0|nr:interleukin-6 receptor subunit beta-like [Lethenteron reissneri]
MRPPRPALLLVTPLLLLLHWAAAVRSGGRPEASLEPQDAVATLGLPFTWRCRLPPGQLGGLERGCTVHDVVWRLAGERLGPPNARPSVEAAAVAALRVSRYGPAGLSKLVCLLDCPSGETLLAAAVVCGASPPEVPTGVMYVMGPDLDGDLMCTWDSLPKSCLPTNYSIIVSVPDTTTTSVHACGAGVARCVVPREHFNIFMTQTFRLLAQSSLGSADHLAEFDPTKFLKTDPPTLDMDDFQLSDYPLVRWSGPRDIDPLVVKLRYHLRYRPSALPQQPWTDVPQNLSATSFALDQLLPHTTYSVQLRCIGGRGQLWWSDWAEANATTAELAPSAGPEVWRVVTPADSEGQRKVFVYWKTLEPDVARGNVLRYAVTAESVDGPFRNATVVVATDRCGDAAATPAAAGGGCSAVLTLDAGAHRLTVTAQNSAGESPASRVGVAAVGSHGPPAPSAVYAAEAGDSTGVLVSWASPGHGAASHRAGAAATAHHVVTWCPVAAAPEGSCRYNFLWLAAGKTSVELRDVVRAGERLDVSVFAVHGDGADVSRPVTVQAYSKQLVPSRGPGVTTQSVTESGATVEWAELTVNESRGFITGYTVYYRATDPRGAIHNVTLGASEPRRLALRDLQAGARYVAWVRAATSGGEGPAGTEHTFAVPSSTRWVVTLATLLLLSVVVGVAVAIALWQLRSHKLLFWQHIPDPADSKLFKSLNLDMACSYSAFPSDDAFVSPVTADGVTADGVSGGGKGGKCRSTITEAGDADPDADSESSSGVGGSSGLSTPRCPSLTAASGDAAAAPAPRVIVSTGYFKTLPVSSGLEIVRLAPGSTAAGEDESCEAMGTAGGRAEDEEAVGAAIPQAVGRQGDAEDDEEEEEEERFSALDLRCGGDGGGGAACGTPPSGCNDFSHLMPPLSPDSGAAGFGDGGQLRLPDDFDIAKLIAVGGL